MVLEKEVPVLGICVGMQVLFSESNEYGNSKGLNWIKGKIINLKEPNIGWSKINILEKNKIIKKGLTSKEYYFLHSFYIKKNKSSIATLNSNISAVINQNNIYGTQFHPENSHEQGVELLKNFTKI